MMYILSCEVGVELGSTGLFDVCFLYFPYSSFHIFFLRVYLSFNLIFFCSLYGVIKELKTFNWGSFFVSGNMTSDTQPSMSKSVNSSRFSFGSSNLNDDASSNNLSGLPNGDEYDSDGSNFAPP